MGYATKIFLVAGAGFLLFWACEVDHETQMLPTPTQPESNILARQLCANRVWADCNAYDSTDIFLWDTVCDGSTEIAITAFQANLLWGHYNNEYGDLGDKACGGVTIPTTVPAITGLTKLTGTTPRMKWDFLWADYYTVKRKIGTGGSYSTIYTYNMPIGCCGSSPDTTFADNSISLRTFGDIVYYQVWAKSFNTWSSTAPVVYWDNRQQK